MDIWSRRDALAALGAVGLVASAAGRAIGQESNDRVARIIADVISVDTHNHIFPPADPTNFDLPGAMKVSGFSAICATFPVDMVAKPTKGQWYQLYQDWTNALDVLLSTKKMRKALTIADLQDAKRRREPIVIQAAEGAQFVEGKLDRIEESYKRGLRHLQIFHSVQDTVAPMGDLQTLDPHFDGLTPFGEDVVRECNRLGIVVDLAHGSFQSIAKAVKISARPIIFSHTALLSPAGLGSIASWDDRRLPMRLLRPDDARVIAEAGGMIGVWHLFPTLKAYVAAIRDLVDTVGVEHVGIGTDTGMVSDIYASNTRWKSSRPGLLFGIVEEMLAQGFAEREIGPIIGGNYCRIFGEATSHPGKP